MDLVADLTLVLLAALAGGFLAQRLGQPLIVGYILAGVVVGPFTGGPTVGNVHDIEQLAELGVALLLFSLGLELSFRELKPVRAVALGGGDHSDRRSRLRWGSASGSGSGWEWRPALWFGALISLSSTMVALKTIQAQGRLGTLSSRVMLGILVVQDLAVVPLMIVLPELSDPAGGAGQGRRSAALRATLLLGVIVLVLDPRRAAPDGVRRALELARAVLSLDDHAGGRRRLRRLVSSGCRWRSAHSSPAWSSTSPNTRIRRSATWCRCAICSACCSSCRSACCSIPALVWQQLGALAFVVVAIVVGKAAILAGVVRAFGYWNVVPLAVGLTLFQVGEFAFVLARVGLSSGAISNDVYTLTLNTGDRHHGAHAGRISSLVPVLYERLWPRRARETFEAINLPSSGTVATTSSIAGVGPRRAQHRRRAVAADAAVRAGRVRRSARAAGTRGRRCR